MSSSAHREEGAHDRHPFRATRPDHDSLLQVPRRERPCVLLRRHSGASVVPRLIQQDVGAGGDSDCRGQLPDRWAVLCRMA